MPLANEHPLIQLARQVAAQPALWRQAAEAARRPEFLNQLARTGQLDSLNAALDDDGPLAPEPLGFVAAALAFETAQASGQAQLARTLAIRSLREPVRYAGLLLIKVEVCSALLKLEPWAAEQIALLLGIMGNALAQATTGDRVENLRAARAAYREAEGIYRELAEKQPGVYRPNLAMTLNNLGTVLGDLRELEAARAAYREAEGIRRELAEKQPGVYRPNLAGTLNNLGTVLRDLRELEAARQAWEEAAELEEEVWVELLSEQARLHHLRELSQMHGGLVSVYSELASRNGRQAMGASRGATNRNQRSCAEQAAYWAERGRARNLADLMAAMEQKPANVPEKQFRDWLDLSRRIGDLDRRIAEEGGQPRSGEGEAAFAKARVLAELLAERQRRHTDCLRLEQALAKADPNWVPGAKPMEVSDLKAVAGQAGAALLTLRPTPWGTAAIAVLPDGRIEATLVKDITTDQVTKLLVRDEEDEPGGGWVVDYHNYRLYPRLLWWQWCGSLETTLKRLGKSLWQPVRQWLSDFYAPSGDSDNPRPLVILAGQGLNILPIHAACWEENGETHWACDDYQISYAPSIWVLQRCIERESRRNKRPETLLALRNPTGHIKEQGLPWSEYEVDEVAKLFPRPESRCILGHAQDAEYPPAICSRVLQELKLPRWAIALLSTHGIYDMFEPWSRSGIFTADMKRAEETIPHLPLSAIFQLDLSGLWLAVLTACESALTDFRDPAGEQLGLPSALLAAGATTAVGSLWIVDDLATGLLSRRFFEELFGCDAEPEMTKGRALWKAQHWLRNLTKKEVEKLFDEIPPDKMPSTTTPAMPDEAEIDRALAQVPASQRAIIERGWRLPQQTVENYRQAVLSRGPHPFEHPVYWSAFACYGAF